MKSKIPALSLLLCVALSAYFLIVGIPKQIEKKTAIQHGLSVLSVEQPLESINPEDKPFTIDAIRVKSSGEDTQGTDDDPYFQAREAYKKRFGYDYDEPWDGQKVTHIFSVTPAMAGMVDFWTEVFGHYGKDQYVFHHRDDVSIVYSVIDLSDLDPMAASLSPEESEKIKKSYLNEEEQRIAKLLKKLTEKISGHDELTPEEKRLADLFHQNPSLSIRDSASDELIRIQSGFAHKMKEAIVLSGQYIPEFEKIFSRMGVPVEITRLPLIESAFKIDAYSSAAAAGLWQFIPDTGKRYLRMDDVVDERYDPFLAAYAAAQHLLNEYKLLGSWPLTINAYNTGPQRMINAKRQLETDDIAVIIKNFKEPGYQFYSRNYYPEFLAALHVYENQEYYFGKLAKKDPLDYDLFLPQQKINLLALARAIDMDFDVLSFLNPSFNKDILSGKKILPPGYMVRVPKEMGRLVSRVAMDYYETGAREEWHIVAQGETLQDLSARYGVSMDVLEDSNHIMAQEVLTAGMAIKIPSTQGVAIGQALPTNSAVE